jgi:hypothetical protein
MLKLGRERIQPTVRMFIQYMNVQKRSNTDEDFAYRRLPIFKGTYIFENFSFYLGLSLALKALSGKR